MKECRPKLIPVENKVRSYVLLSCLLRKRLSPDGDFVFTAIINAIYCSSSLMKARLRYTCLIACAYYKECVAIRCASRNPCRINENTETSCRPGNETISQILDVSSVWAVRFNDNIRSHKYKLSFFQSSIPPSHSLSLSRLSHSLSLFLSVYPRFSHSAKQYR